MKLTWVDIRACGAKAAVMEEALHQRVDGVVSDNVEDFAGLPPTIKKVLFPQGRELPADLGPADIVIAVPGEHGLPEELAQAHPDVEFGRYVAITDPATLEEACQSAQIYPWSLLYFRDPTKIPLE